MAEIRTQTSGFAPPSDTRASGILSPRGHTTEHQEEDVKNGSKLIGIGTGLSTNHSATVVRTGLSSNHSAMVVRTGLSSNHSATVVRTTR